MSSPTKTSTYDPLTVLVSILKGNIKSNPDDWKSRKEYARLLYDEGMTKEAAEIIWSAPSIPSIDLEIGFSVKILSKGAPRRAIRLLTQLQQLNQGKPVQNMGIANALLHHGMVMQAARFYGAAIQLDPSLANPNLEHFLLWVDDSEKLWGDFKDQPQIFEELPWIKREEKDQASQLAAFKSGHTTPIKIPGLAKSPGEFGSNPLYTQDPRLNRPVGPPPAVTIPMDRVEDRHLLIDNRSGAESRVTAFVEEQPAEVGNTFGVPLPNANQQFYAAEFLPPVQTQPILATDGTYAPHVYLPRKNFVMRGNKIVRAAPAIDPRAGAPVRINQSQY